MQRTDSLVLVELNKNRLRVVTSDLKFGEVDVDRSVVSDTKILEVDAFSKCLKDLIKSLGTKVRGVVFLVEEKDIYDRFFVERNDDDSANRLKSQAMAFVGGSLDGLYCVYQKVSPFIYQFIGINREMVDTFKKVSGEISLKLEGILPTSFVFAKFTGSYDPFFFIFRGEEESTLIASEFGGVYFSGTHLASDITQKMSHLIKELSTFNREKPVTNLYVVGPVFDVAGKFTVRQLSVPFELEETRARGFERLLVSLSVVKNFYDEVLNSYFNFRNVVETSVANRPGMSVSKYAVPALVIVSVISAGALYYLNFYSGAVPTGKLQADTGPSVEGVNEATRSSFPEQVEASQTAKPAELNKASLKIRVENGAGVAGTAAKAKDYLASLGYNVVEIGNAQSFDFSQTEIRIKESKKEFLDVLKADLSKNYEVKVSDSLSESSSSDALITVGKK